MANHRGRDPVDEPYSDLDSDSVLEDDENLKTSVELARYDQELLDDDEANEKLLMANKSGHSEPGRIKTVLKSGFKVGAYAPPQDEQTPKKRSRRRKKREEKELMHEMEEGGPRSVTPSSDDSSELDRENLGTTQARKKTSFIGKCCKYTLINTIIAVLFGFIAIAAYRATRKDAVFHKLQHQKLLSNGTALFPPTTLLISLDGFRADFLQRNITPTLNSFIKEGVSPMYILPSFPSVTFPNHYTLVTGLYPESHGIVGNEFYDPDFQEEFYYTHPEHSMQPKWWGGEPLWETAEQQGVRTAIHMWPGSEAHIGELEPSFLDKFNGSEVLPRKVDRILELLDKPGLETNGTVDIDLLRPQLIAAYVPDVDRDGHKFGPNSTEIKDTISEVDAMLFDIFDGLEQRNLTNIVNVVIVSDHGMATTSASRTIQFEDLVDPSTVAHIEGWPHYGLRLKNPDDLQPLYTRLKNATSTHGGFDVYLRDENMPPRYHFTRNKRIAPLWLMPRTGWAIVQKHEFDVAAAAADSSLVYHPRGIHGYDHEHPLMRAIFVARGPAFPHTPNSRVDVFQNTEVYNILCDSLDIEPRPNNGTLRLPLKTVGVHENGSAGGGVVQDPPEDGDGEGQEQGKAEQVKVWIIETWDEFREWIDGVFQDIRDGADPKQGGQ